jgi:hypothetical protein
MNNPDVPAYEQDRDREQKLNLWRSPDFTPDESLYGRDVFDGDDESRLGVLEEILSPFHFLIGGLVYDVGETDKFFEDGGLLCIQSYEVYDIDGTKRTDGEDD